MTRTMISACALLLFATAANADECARPDTPTVPDGSTASHADMVAAQQAVQGFLAEADEYRACLQEQSRAIGEAETEEQEARQAALTEAFNGTVDEMHAIGDAFNESVQAFNAQGE